MIGRCRGQVEPEPLDHAEGNALRAIGTPLSVAAKRRTQWRCEANAALRSRAAPARGSAKRLDRLWPGHASDLTAFGPPEALSDRAGRPRHYLNDLGPKSLYLRLGPEFREGTS